MSATVSEQPLQHNLRTFEIELSTRYAWKYQTFSEKVQNLYRLGNEKAWNPDQAIDWSSGLPHDKSPVRWDDNPYRFYKPYLALSEADRILFDRKRQSWGISQILHGEQGALMVASQLVSCLPEYEAKLYAASQAFDEARHVYVFSRYLTEHTQLLYPIDPNLEELIDKILMDKRWDVKFLGMQVIIEGLALSGFDMTRRMTTDNLLLQIIMSVLPDESRHVNFGLYRLKDYLQTLSEEEIEDRARFAYEACAAMRLRFFPKPVFEEFGMDIEDAKTVLQNSPMWQRFLLDLFAKVIPNLQKLGLLTPRVTPLYREMGALADLEKAAEPN